MSHSKELNLTNLGLFGDTVASSEDGRSHFSVSLPIRRSLTEISRDLKRFLINETLRQSGGNRQGAAGLLGISRNSLKHHMRSLAHEDEHIVGISREN